jgi:hypothetical protein
MESTPLTRRRIRMPAATIASVFDDAIAQNLAVMDATAFALCRDQKAANQRLLDFQAGCAAAGGDG